jgi:hypothetical protein
VIKRNRSSRLAAGAIVLACAALGLGITAAHAATQADLRAGLYPDADGVAMGAGVLTPISSSDRWGFNPNAEFAFGDDRNVYTFNGDVHYSLPVARSVDYWVGGGPALLVRDPSVGNSNTDVGVNVLMGVGGRQGTVRPFGQLKGVIADDSEVALMGGIHF